MPERSTRSQTLTAAPTVTVSGVALTPREWERLIEVRAEHALGIPSKVTLRFDDRDYRFVDGSFEVGGTLDIKFPKPTGGSVLVFKGEIVAVGFEHNQGSDEFIVEAQDKSHRFAFGSHVRTFQNVSYGDIVSKVCSEAGLTAQVDQSLNSPIFEYYVQTCTTTEMFDRIAAATATYWTVDDEKLMFTKRASAPEVKFKAGEDVTRFRVRYNSSGAGVDVSARSWDPAKKEAVVGANSDALRLDFAGSSQPGGLANFKRGTNGLARQAKYVNGAAGALSMAEAKAVAEALAVRQAATRITARGEVLGTPELRAGMFVNMTNFGTRLSGKYFVTNVEHVFAVGIDFVTRFTVGGLQNHAVVDLLGSRGGSIGHWPGPGVVIGLVTNHWDEQHKGMVKVKFPSLSDQDESAWARVMSVAGGAGGGIQFWPEINDEVLVMFEQGDLRRPIVIGHLWNAKDQPPYRAKADMIEGDKVSKRVIKSRTGHIIEMCDIDSPAKSEILIKNKDGKTFLRLAGDKAELIVNQDNPLELKSGQASIVLKNGDIKITGKTISIEATEKVTVKGTQEVAVSGAEVKVSANSKLDLKASAAAELNGGGKLDLKAGMIKIN